MKKTAQFSATIEVDFSVEITGRNLDLSNLPESILEQIRNLIEIAVSDKPVKINRQTTIENTGDPYISEPELTLIGQIEELP